MTPHRLSRGPVLAAAVMAVAALTAPLVIAAPTEARSAAPERVTAKKVGANDFNGDGIRDLAVAAPGGTAGKRAKAGLVAVLYGSKTKPLTAHRQVVHQDSPGIPGTAASGDQFGAALASGDLDRDGHADLLVGAFKDSLGAGQKEAGSLSVIWGGPKGLSGGATLLNGSESHALLGKSLAVADFDGDGDPDVATTSGQSELRLLSGPFTRNGSPTASTNIVNDGERITDLAAGDLNRDGRTDLVAARYNPDLYEHPETAVWTGTTRGLAPVARVLRKDVNDRTTPGGDNVDVGDVNRDGYADIVVGRDDFRETDMGAGKGGRIVFFPGSKNGPVVSKVVVLNQGSKGVPGTAEYGDYFGSGVSVSDVDGDGYADIATGLPGKKVGTVREAGAVVVLRGGATGPRSTGAKLFTQSTTGVPGTSETKDTFGFATALVDLNGDARPELVVGGTGEDQGAGSVWVLKGTKSGPTARGATSFGHGSLGTSAAPLSALGFSFSNANNYRY
ncbi:FG-GAP-like repeat-containing protein [Streptomyces sp. NPDC005963]|uniref:FG-GAP and VCBS repeat-containing protein n=1 Tax=Streptomyces sp. NPDC005963 TaxID=3156721 RepID=UPI0033DBBBC4